MKRCKRHDWMKEWDDCPDCLSERSPDSSAAIGSADQDGMSSANGPPHSPVVRCQWLDDDLMQCEEDAVGRFILHGDTECHDQGMSVATYLCDAHRSGCSEHWERHRPSERRANGPEPQHCVVTPPEKDATSPTQTLPVTPDVVAHQKVSIVLTDTLVEGEVDCQIVFEPNISDDTESPSVRAALEIMESILGVEEPRHAVANEVSGRRND